MEMEAEKQSDFIAELAAAGILEKTRQEPGNISYELFVPVCGPGSLCMVERWEGPEHLPGHMAGENFKAMSALGEKYGVRNDVKVYQAKALK